MARKKVTSVPALADWGAVDNACGTSGSASTRWRKWLSSVTAR